VRCKNSQYLTQANNHYNRVKKLKAKVKSKGCFWFAGEKVKSKVISQTPASFFFSAVAFGGANT